MKLLMLIYVVFSILLIPICRCLEINPGNWENINYLRSIDLGRSYVKETCLIEAKNVEKRPQNEYYFTVNDGFNVVPNVSLISVELSEVRQPLEPQFVSEGIYKIELPVAISPGSAVDLKVSYVYTDVISAFPSKLEMHELQNLLLKLNKFVYSPYVTKSYRLVFTGISKGQEMQLTLSNAEEFGITDNTPDLRPSVENKSLVYGPSPVEIQPYTVQPMGLLYQHNRPLAKAATLDRSIWIPASENNKIAIEEYYELTNSAAELKSGFLRSQWLKGKYEASSNHWALSHLIFPISKTSAFEDYYFSDKVGMVSNHQIHENNLFLQPRYPLFGGWRYNFSLGWNNYIQDHIHKVSGQQDTYIARFPLLNTIKDISYEDLTLNFYLPENAELLNVSSPIEFWDLQVDNELSYLDVSKGHVKVTLKFKNLFDSMNNLDVFVVYRYTQASFWLKIVKISGFVFLGLTSYYFLKLIDISIASKKK